MALADRWCCQVREERTERALRQTAMPGSRGRWPGAYEAGLPVAFAGLFAGETRRRISVPGYPFEHRCYWVESPKT